MDAALRLDTRAIRRDSRTRPLLPAAALLGEVLRSRHAANRLANIVLAAAVAITGLLLPGIGAEDRPAATASDPQPLVSEQTRRVPDVPDAAVGARRAQGRATRTTVAMLSAVTVEPFTMVGVTWAESAAGADPQVEIRAHSQNGWSGWQPLTVDQDGPGPAEQTRAGTVPTWVGHADGIAVRLLTRPHEAPRDVEVVTLDGGTGLAEPALRLTAADTADTASGIPPRPTVVTRAQWGVDTSTQVKCASPTTAATMSGVVLHHTAGSNDYTAAEAPGIVRAIHRYHTASRGWCDIGYNFLVDNYGTVYEGRRGGIDLQVRGAHAGNADVNLYTTGIAMMGNFETVDVPAATKQAVVDFMAWRLASFGLDTYDTMTFDGITVPSIIGHKDVSLSGIRPATATACPGKYGDGWLDTELRGQVQAVIEEYAGRQPEPTPPTVERLGGNDRYETAAAVARDAFPGIAGVVFLASGTTFPDALSAGPAAARAGAPVLLTRPGGLPDVSATELQRLAPSLVYLVGGEAAISDTVAAQVRQHTPDVVRLAGPNRYGTGVAVAGALWSTSPVVYLASGQDYADALSGGALAAKDSAPVLLSPSSRLSDPVRDALVPLNPGRVVLLGGPGALSDSVMEQVSAAVPAARVTRLAGSDRYATSAAIASSGWSSTTKAYLATGLTFPDALAGVPGAGAHAAPLLLVRPDCQPGPVADMLAVLDPDTRVLLGGSGALSEGAATDRCAG